MYTINKIVGYLISPAGFGIALVSAAVLARVLEAEFLVDGRVPRVESLPLRKRSRRSLL